MLIFGCISVLSKKIHTYKILWKSVNWGPSCTMRTEDRHDEADGRLSEFCERTLKLQRALLDWYPGKFEAVNQHTTEVLSVTRRNTLRNSVELSYIWWAGKRSRYSDWLRAGGSGDRIPVGARFSAPVQTSPGAHPPSCTMGTGSFPRVKSGRGLTLTPHPLLVPLVMKE